MRQGILYLVKSIFLLALAMPVLGTTAEDAELLEKASLAAKQGALDKAVALYRQVLEKDPENTAARQGLAVVLVDNQIRDPYSEDPFLNVFDHESCNQSGM